MCSTNESSILFDCHMSNASALGMFSEYKEMLIALVPNTVLSVIATTFDNFEYNPWVFALLGSAIIGLSGIFPLLIIPVDDAENFKSAGKMSGLYSAFIIICTCFLKVKQRNCKHLEPPLCGSI